MTRTGRPPSTDLWRWLQCQGLITRKMATDYRTGRVVPELLQVAGWCRDLGLTVRLPEVPLLLARLERQRERSG